MVVIDEELLERRLVPVEQAGDEALVLGMDHGRDGRHAP
jgi:hypothetical protein